MFNGQVIIAAQIMAFAALKAPEAKHEREKMWQAAQLLKRYPDCGRRRFEAMLQKLTAQGWLGSKRGPTGGYFLTEEGDFVTALDLVLINAKPREVPFVEMFAERLDLFTASELIDIKETHERAKKLGRKRVGTLRAA